MYQKILVPLDGSAYSESSLEHAQSIALAMKTSEVILLRVIEPVPGYAILSEDWHNEAAKREQSWTENYLNTVAQKLSGQGIPVKTAMIVGNAADEILNYIEKNKVDLIIMSTHGNSGVMRWLLGSVAERVVRHASVPLMLITPKAVDHKK